MESISLQQRLEFGMDEWMNFLLLLRECTAYYTRSMWKFTVSILKKRNKVSLDYSAVETVRNNKMCIFTLLIFIKLHCKMKEIKINPRK